MSVNTVKIKGNKMKIKKNWRDLKDIENPSKDLQMEAVKQNYNALKYINTKLIPKEVFILALQGKWQNKKNENSLNYNANKAKNKKNYCKKIYVIQDKTKIPISKLCNLDEEDLYKLLYIKSFLVNGWGTDIIKDVIYSTPEKPYKVSYKQKEHFFRSVCRCASNIINILNDQQGFNQNQLTLEDIFSITETNIELYEKIYNIAFEWKGTSKLLSFNLSINRTFYSEYSFYKKMFSFMKDYKKREDKKTNIIKFKSDLYFSLIYNNYNIPKRYTLYDTFYDTDNCTEKMCLDILDICYKNNCKYAIKDIQNPTESVQLKALSYSIYAMKYIEHPTEKVQLEAIKISPYIIGWINNPTEKVQLEAVKQDATLINFIENPSKELQRKLNEN